MSIWTLNQFELLLLGMLCNIHFPTLHVNYILYWCERISLLYPRKSFFFRQKFAFRQGNQWRLMSWDILIQIWDVSATLQYFCGWNQNKKHVDLSKPCNIPASKWHFSRFFQNILSCSSVPLQLSFQLQSIHRNCLAVHCLVHTVHGKVGQNAYLVALPDE